MHFLVRGGQNPDYPEANPPRTSIASPVQTGGENAFAGTKVPMGRYVISRVRSMPEHSNGKNMALLHISYTIPYFFSVVVSAL
jgi:hypothetical protein